MWLDKLRGAATGAAIPRRKATSRPAGGRPPRRASLALVEPARAGIALLPRGGERNPRRR